MKRIRILEPFFQTRGRACPKICVREDRLRPEATRIPVQILLLQLSSFYSDCVTAVWVEVISELFIHFVR